MIRAVIALAALAGATPAQAQARCLGDRDAEAIVLVALPDVIRETGRICTALPAASPLRRTTGAFLAKYQDAADRAWPDARTAIVKLSDPATQVLLQSDYARPVLTSLAVAQVVGRITPADCATIDRYATLLEGLAPRNTAGVVVTTLRLLQQEKAKGRAPAAPSLPLCPAR